MTGIPANLRKPDYTGGSIVNLMSSLLAALGNEASPYPHLRALEPERIRRFRNTILLVVDGLGYRYLLEHGAGSFLRSRLVGRMTSVYPPTTATAIPTFFTGYAPLQHGFTGWFSYFRELACMLAVLPFRSRCGGASLAQAGINPRSLSGVKPVFERMQAHSFVVAPERIAGSAFNTSFSAGAETRAYGTLQQMVDAIRSCVTRTGQRTYVYAYWPEYDALAHRFGVSGDQVAEHFAQLDAAISDLATALRGSGSCLIVTADHGFIDTAPAHLLLLEQHPNLCETLRLPLSGEPRTVYCYVYPNRQAAFEQYVKSELADVAFLLPSNEFAAQGFLGLGEAHPRLGDRIGDYVLLMQSDYVLKDWILGETPYIHYGVHGGGSCEELYVPLVVIDD